MIEKEVIENEKRAQKNLQSNAKKRFFVPPLKSLKFALCYRSRRMKNASQ